MSFFVARHFRSLFLFFDDDAVASPRSTVSRSTVSRSTVSSNNVPSRTTPQQNRLSPKPLPCGQILEVAAQIPSCC